MSFFSNRRQAEDMVNSMDDLSQNPRPIAAPQPVGFETVLGANCAMEGVLRSRANVRLDGTFTGTLEIEGNVLVGETAKINADIDAKNISIAGAVRGNVTGKKVQLLRTGRIWGDIRALALTTEEGAFIDGKITMVGHQASQAPDEDPAFVTEITESPDESSAETDPESPPADFEDGLDEANTDDIQPGV
jgi:cytoskeletal protein CcmA (bactofilin family)